MRCSPGRRRGYRRDEMAELKKKLLKRYHSEDAMKDALSYAKKAEALYPGNVVIETQGQPGARNFECLVMRLKIPEPPGPTHQTGEWSREQHRFNKHPREIGEHHCYLPSNVGLGTKWLCDECGKSWVLGRDGWGSSL